MRLKAEQMKQWGEGTLNYEAAVTALPLTSTELQVGQAVWGGGCQVGPCTWRRDMQIWRRAIWVAIFTSCTSDFTIYHYLFFFGSPSQCMEFHCGDNKMEKNH